MNKNIKRMFFVTTLILLLVSISALSAADASNDTSSTIQQEVVKEVNVEKVSDNIITDTNTKNIKKETTTDLYVSDTDGSDDNSGTNNSPLKTLQGALDKTTSEGTYNIHIAEGTYKGLGNTNLTVNGNYNINIVGEGMNKTVFDGEAQYTIGGSSVWGGDEYWNSYSYQNANYFLTITEGTGHITLSNFNIEHMASIGGQSIDLYLHATIDNYANLTVDNIFFYYNMAGVGSAIRNQRSGTVTMTNCLLTENRKSSTTGNDGAIYNNGTMIIENSIFDHNAGRWGVILNDYKLDIKDSIMKNGISYDLSSTYKFGSGIASNSGQADGSHVYRVEDVETNITNVTFENNGQTDIYQGVGTLNVNNCKFFNSTGIYIAPYVQHNNATPFEMTINGSTFKDIKASSLFGSLSVKTGTIFGIYSEGNYQLLIENNTIELSEKGYGIRIVNNTIIRNNQLNNYIAIEGNNNTISQNIINSTKQVYTIELAPNSQENTITDNMLYSSMLTGTKSILNNSKNNIISNNIPESGENIILNNENYNEYFDENGVNIAEKITNGSFISIESLDNKKLIIDNVKIVVTTTSHGVTLNNIQIQTNPNAKLLLTNTRINNDNLENIIILNSSDNILQNITINSNTSNNIIVIEEDYNTLDTIYITSNVTNTERKNTVLSVKSSNNEFIQLTINSNKFMEDVTNDLTLLDIQNTDNNKVFESQLIASNSTNVIGINAKNSSNALLNVKVYVLDCEKGTAIFVIDSTNVSITDGRIELDGNNTGIYVDSSYNTYISTFIQLRGNYSKAISVYNSYNTTITPEDNEMSIQLWSNNTKPIELNNSNYTQIKLLTIANIYNTINEEVFIDINNSHYNLMEGIIIREKVDSNGNRLGSTPVLIKLTNSSNNKISSYITGDEEVKSILSSNNTLIELKNSYNNNITGIEAISTLNSITMISSNNNNINNNNITSEDANIVLDNSNNNQINNNYITSNNNYTILIENSNENIVINNEMHALNQTLIGDECVIGNTAENTIENNTPGKYYLTNENYDDLFTDNTFNHDYYCEIIILSDLYNKELIFPKQVLITNPDKHTLYNSTLTISGDNTIVNDLTFNSTKDLSTIITVIGDKVILNNITVYHENDNIIRSIVNKADNSLFNYLNLTTIGAEIETTDNTPSIISIYSESKLRLNNSNIKTSYKSFDQKGTTNSIYSQYINMTNTTINTLGNNIAIGLNTTGQANGQIYVTVKSNNTSIGSNGDISRSQAGDSMLLVESNGTAIGQSNTKNQYSPMTVLAENLAVGIYEVNDINLSSATYDFDKIIKSNNTSYGIYLKDSGSVTTGNIYVRSHYMDISGKNTTAIYAENVNCPGIYIYNDNIKLNGSNTRALYTNNLNIYYGISIAYSNITITTENNTSPVYINNTMSTYRWPSISIYNDIIRVLNYDLTNPIVNIENTNISSSVYNNYLYSTGVCGENSINITNVTGSITTSNNTPIDLNSLPVQFNIKGLDNLYRDANNITITVTNYDDELMNGTITIDFGPTEERFENIALENGTANIYFTPNATEVLRQSINDTYAGASFFNRGFTLLNVTITYTTNTPSYLSPQTFTKSNIRVTRHNITLTTNNITGITHNPTTITTTVVDNFNRPVNEGIVTYVFRNTVYGQAPVINGIATTSIIFNDTINTNSFQSQYTGSAYIYNNYTLFGNCTIVEPELVVNPVTATVGETTRISASIMAFDETVTNINKGKITFKVNGKTLKDTNGKVIYAKVVNGVATIENYVVPEDWSKDGTTIQAIYSGSTECEKLTSEKTNLTITPKELTLTTKDTTATIGSTTTLIATLSDNTINTGKIVFKINGKTVKDPNGKVIYAKVVNGQVSVEYTIPENMKAKDYNITATYISSDYRLEDTKTLTITA